MTDNITKIYTTLAKEVVPHNPRSLSPPFAPGRLQALARTIAVRVRLRLNHGTEFAVNKCRQNHVLEQFDRL